MSKPTPISVEIGPDLFFPYEVYEQDGERRVYQDAYSHLAAILSDYPEGSIPEEIRAHFAQAQAWPVFHVEGARSWVLVKEADVERAHRVGQIALGDKPVLSVRLATQEELLAYQSLQGELHPFQYNHPLPKNRPR
jgi:hypothetical protein